MSEPYSNGSADPGAGRALVRAKAQPDEQALKLTDEDFLAIVSAERRQAVGMEEDNEILSEREMALEYFKGVMDDIVTLPGRSQVVSSEVSDAILTALPDLCEIFMSGEEIGSFRPVGEEDVEPAKQETQVVNHVIMNENDGYALVHDAIHDALLTKVGVVHVWAETESKEESETLDMLSAVSLQAIIEAGDSEISNVEPQALDDLTGEQLYRVTVAKNYNTTCVKNMVYPPEDFAVARDTVAIRDATYCVLRLRPRAQDLKAQGIDAAIVDRLAAYSGNTQREVDAARDQAGETNEQPGSSDATHDLRQVCVYRHVLRVDADGDGKPEIWQIDTDENEGVILQKSRLNLVPFAVGTPYRMPHRLYGRSLADLLIELQRIKTALLRMHLDGGFFSLNQRMEVSEASANEHTLTDLLNNTPGYPVRSKDGQALRPLVSSKGDFSTLDSLEYFSTVGEQRTGIVRNAQGLNPDTLHDTAKGAMQLMAAAARRTRFIARTLAETLFRDVFIITHALLREHGAQKITARIRNKWVTVDPTSWGARKDMTIEIGAGTRQEDLMILNMVAERAAQVVQAQGGFTGPLVKPENAYALLVDMTERAGVKQATRYWSDPAEQPQAQPGQEAPDPDLLKVQAEAKLKAAQMQSDHQLEQQRIAQEKELAIIRIANERDLAQQKAVMEGEIAVFKARLEAQTAQTKIANIGGGGYRPGGRLDE